MSAEEQFRKAFERLKLGIPIRMPIGTEVTQNNVAKEAGTDTTALRKSRYPKLVREIQTYIKANAETAPRSRRQTILNERKRNRTKQQELDNCRAQRDQLTSMLLEADATILELAHKLAVLESRLPASNVHPLHLSDDDLN